MKMMITITAMTLGAGVAILLFSRSSARRKREPRMTFAELYEDNLSGEAGSLFD